jgi:hypothetical protein
MVNYGKNYHQHYADEQQHFTARSQTSTLSMNITGKMRFAAFALLLGCTPLRLHAQPQPAGPKPAPAWAGQYDTHSRSEDVYIVSKGDKKGVVSLAGKPITKLTYDTILPFREGIAIVGMLRRGRFKTSGKYGYLDKQGTLVVPMEHTGLESYSEGVAIISGGWCYHHYIDKKGKILFSLYANPAYSFQGGMSRIDVIPDSSGIPINDKAGQAGWKRNYVDHQGNLLIPARYDSIGEYVHYGVRTIKRHGKYGFLDTTGQEVLPPAFDDIDYDSSYFWANRRRVGQYGRFGFVDTYTGRLVVPVHYQGSLPSQNSLCWLKLNEKWGLVSFSGTTAIPFQYDQVSSFTEGLARVGRDGRFGHVNGRGEVVTPLQYDNVFPFREGRAMVIKADRCGFVNTRGEEVIPAVYNRGQYYFRDGRVTVSRWGVFFTIDPTGRQVAYRLSGRLKTTLAGVLLLLGAGYRVFRRKDRPAATVAYADGLAD